MNKQEIDNLKTDIHQVK